MSAQNPWGKAGYAPAAAFAPGYYPPKKKRISLVTLLVWLVVVPAVVIFLIIFFQALSEVISESDNAAPAPSAPATFTAGPGDGDSPEPDDWGDDGWANDNYQVPPYDAKPPKLPWPDTYGEADDWLVSNSIYSTSVKRPVRCELKQINPSKSSKDAMSKYLNDMVPCLMRVWGPELEAAGYKAVTPKVHVYSGSGQSACGKLSPGNAFYCPADQQIYYALDMADEFPGYKNEPLVPLQVVAHEFGHGLQGRTGILAAEDAYLDYFEDRGDKWSAKAIERRLEMQADCFAGLFVGSVDKSLQIGPEGMYTLFDFMVELGDDTITGDSNYVGDHGHGVNRQAWFMKGVSKPQVSVCNTFLENIPEQELA